MESIRLPPLPHHASKQIMPSFSPSGRVDQTPQPVIQQQHEVVKHVDYDKILIALSGFYGPHLYDRYSTVIDRLTRVCNEGIPLADVGRITSVLNALHTTLIREGAELAPDVRRLLGACGNALLLQSEVDLSAQEPVVSQFVNQVGDFIQTQLDEVVEIAADITFKMTGKQGEYDRAEAAYHYICLDWQQKSPKRKKQETWSGFAFLPHIENAVVAPKLLQALRSISTLSCEWKVLRALRKLSSASVVCCQQIIQDRQLAFLCECAARLPDESLVAIAVDIMFNVLEGDDTNQGAQILGSLECITELSSVYQKLVRKEYQKPDEHLRNELLLLLTRIAELCPESRPNFSQTGFVALMCNTLLAGKQPSSEDFQLWKLSIRNLMVLCQNESNLANALEAGLLKFAFAYLQEDHAVKFGWSRTQLKEIQVLILGMLTELVSRTINEFKPKEGDIRALNFLAWAIKCDSGERRDAAGMPEEMMGLVPATLKLLLATAELGVTHKKDLGSHGVFEHAIYLLRSSSNQIELVYNAMVLCSTLCQGSKANKILFGKAGGVSALIPYFKYDSANPKLRNKIVVGLVECIWMCVSGCHSSEEEFLQSGGMFMLLDRMEMTPQPLKKHIMGCALDLLENPKARFHVLEWRSVVDESQGIGHLLIDMWHKEEENLGVPQGPYGELTELEDPLNIQAYPREALSEGIAVPEISMNMRAKVYSMFTKLGFEPFQEILSAEQKIKLLLIAKYLDFKLGEVWEEICGELDQEGVRPVTPDLDCVLTSKQVQLEKASTVRQRQLDLVKKKMEGDSAKERTFLQEKITQINTQQH
ncbi:hypothetical protein SmJEL517_g04137 [Synchytrium microbalum]|uniref:Cilia- and flagella-associated protein 69 ARM repeats domain-containing protein n=1 Tax=Synchytrium microbalum TaxID=1806994 RepID=A0A507C0B5_9FUNG|nr:uncharacterized protein SmJEL517_g04137 [Synchytrium microbalum]TPX32808.1 hypothetical protein SmJEL517_g04137 [Synchytrium microbalum]